MYLRVIVLVAILANRILIPFVTILMPALIVAWAGRLVAVPQGGEERRAEPARQSNALVPALGFLAFVAIAAVVARWAQGRLASRASPSSCS
jgi:uncharacterized membrane protein (DUF4010 family)